jgi:hypothetical protein
MLSLDAYQNGSYTSGTVSWLLTVIISSPSGLVAQVSFFCFLFS